MPGAVGIHHIKPANVSLLESVEADVFDAPIDPAALAIYANAPGHALFVAVEKRRVVAQIRGIIHRHPDALPSLFIENLGVTPRLQRRRIATCLVDALFAWAAESGVSGSFWVAAEGDNEQAIGFYQSLGLVPKPMIYFERD